MNVTSIEPKATDNNESLIFVASMLMKQHHYSQVIEMLTPLVKMMDTRQPDSDQILALLMLSDAQRFSGDPVSAYKNYVVVSEIDPNRAAELLPHMLNCLAKIQTPLDAPVFEQHLIQYFNSPAHDNAEIDYLVRNLLKRKLALDNDEAELDFIALIQNKFLLEAITHLTLADGSVETFLNQLRGQVFQLAIESDLSEALQPAVIAFAAHAELVEYAFPVADHEHVLLLGLESLLRSDIRSVSDVHAHLGTLCLYAMYESPSNLGLATNFTAANLLTFPEPIQPLFKRLFFDQLEERSLTSSIPSIGPVTHHVSIEVMQQYEQNPYPRWQGLFVAKNKLPYLELYPNIKPLMRNANRFSRHLKLLVAGCGTGKQPLWLAANCKDISIKALDLSFPSLGYARRKSNELNLTKNVTFIQGDILDLAHQEETYDIIECSGVLHHMQNPEAGLKALVSRLRKDGVLRLGLYSKIARDRIGINAARQHGTEASLENIRKLRASYLQSGEALPNLSRDFYSTSECRDLLFHVQEHQFNLIEIKQLIERNGLVFLGFDHSAADVHQAFRAQYGDAADNLDYWHEFEQNNPYIFKGMYQFHCQKRP